jgi:hypothetical protein
VWRGEPARAPRVGRVGYLGRPSLLCQTAAMFKPVYRLPPAPVASLIVLLALLWWAALIGAIFWLVDYLERFG